MGDKWQAVQKEQLDSLFFYFLTGYMGVELRLTSIYPIK